MASSELLLSKRVAIMIAGASLFLVVGMIALSLVHAYLVYFYTVPGFIILCLYFGIVNPALLYLATRRRIAVVALLVLVNVFSFMAMVYFCGFYTPFVLLWGVILVLTYLYGGRLASYASACLLLLETGITLYAYRDTPIGGSYTLIVVFSVLVAIGTIALSYLIAALIDNARDRTARLAESKRSEELQLSRVNTLLNSISDVVLTLDKYGRVTSQNSAALSFFDTNQSLVGKNIDTLINLKDTSSQPVSIRQLAEQTKTTTVRDDVSIDDGHDGLTRLSVQLSPIHSTYGDDERGCVVIIRDITRQKTLEDEKDEFISVTSHELRTPVTIAEGSLSNLLFLFEKGATPEQLTQSASTAHDQILYLARMINDLSTLSRAERGVGDVTEEIDVNSMLQELYIRYQPEAEAKKLRLDLDLDKLPTVTTSRLYLEEILQNFLTNAIKYTKEGSVTLAGKLRDGKIECSVRDTGIGISKTDQEKIFEKFFRSEDYRTRETSGTGLGLYVVRKLADKLDTKISVESRLNHGSTFSFILPGNTAAIDTAAQPDA